MNDKKNFFDQLDPKSALIVGLVGGLLTLGTLGFIVLGVLVVKNGSIGSATVAVTQPSPAAPAGAVVDNNQPSQQPAPSNVEVGVGHLPAKGNAGAKVTIIEFADFRCPFCERFYNDAVKGVMKDYVATGKVKYYFRHYAFLGPESTWASEAAECANAQGKFWAMHDWLYENQASESDTAYYTKENLIKYATQLGLNKAQFASCLNSDTYASAVSKDLSDGQAAGVNGTPTIFINGRPLVGAQPYSAVKAVIEQALN